MKRDIKKNRLCKQKQMNKDQTIAKFLNVELFPFKIYENNNLLYWEESNGNWDKFEYDEDYSNPSYSVNSEGKSRGVSVHRYNDNDIHTIAKFLNVSKFPFVINDENGNIIYKEEKSEYWFKRKYENGMKVYYENSNGSWVEWRYDEEGRNIHYGTSEMYIEHREYDNQGQLTYFGNNKGEHLGESKYGEHLGVSGRSGVNIIEGDETYEDPNLITREKTLDGKTIVIDDRTYKLTLID